MTPTEVRELLRGTLFGTVGFVGSTGSTNADLLAAARSGARAGSVLVADHQTAGRGRQGRSWVAPAGSALLASVLLRPPWDPEQAALLSPATALAVRDACASHGVPVRLKWPNDVVATEPGARCGATGEATPDGGCEAACRGGVGAGDTAEPHGGEAKLAGVLAELDSSGGSPAVVVGLGVNVHSHAGLAAAVETARTAGDVPALPPVALDALVPGAPDRNELLVAVLLGLDAWCRRLGEPHGARHLVDELRRYSSTLGRRVRVRTPGGTVEGRATDLSGQGHLVVATTAGTVTVSAGDCHHLRFAPA